MPSLISRVVDSLRATRSSWLLTCASPNRDLTTRLQDRQHGAGRHAAQESDRLAATRCTVLEMAPLVERTSGWSVRLPAKLTAAWAMVCPFLLPGRAGCPAPGTGGRWTPWHATRPPGASGEANEVGSGAGLVGGVLAAGGRACQHRPARGFHPGRGGRSRLPP